MLQRERATREMAGRPFFRPKFHCMIIFSRGFCGPVRRTSDGMLNRLCFDWILFAASSFVSPPIALTMGLILAGFAASLSEGDAKVLALAIASLSRGPWFRNELA